MIDINKAVPYVETMATGISATVTMRAVAAIDTQAGICRERQDNNSLG